MRRLLPILVLPLAVLAQSIEIADIVSVRTDGAPAQWIHKVNLSAPAREQSCDMLVAGAGMGGVAAAIAATDQGHTVCLTDPTHWLGGQMTSGGVSALDENKFIEISGASRTYREMRDRIRAKYNGKTNPGDCYVSSLCFEPKVGVAVLEEMLAPRKSRITWMPRTDIVELERKGRQIVSALAYNYETRQLTRIRAKAYLDATEMGDLLPLAKVPYTLGSESRAETGEPHAPNEANPACVQSFTYPFILERQLAPGPLTSKPEAYEKIRDHQPFSLTMNYPTDLGWRGSFTYHVFGEEAPIPNNMSPKPLYSWRRVLHIEGQPERALMNWPRQDYHDESILDRNALDTVRIIQAAKRVAFSFLYWLQADLAHPELQIVKDAMGSTDGLAQYPYIRESRRLKTSLTVREQDVVSDYQPNSRARQYPSSIGTGFYMVDIHPCGSNERGRMMMPKPFQVPVELLLPEGVDNLFAAGKTLGVTHITNGAFRLHPIEWNVGEAAATLASLRLRNQEAQLQQALVKRGVPIVWFDDLRTTHPAFASIQLAAIHGAYPLSPIDLHASPEAPITRFEVAQALAAHLAQLQLPKEAAARFAVDSGWMAVDHRNWFHGDLPTLSSDIRNLKVTGLQPLTRAAFAQLLYPQ
ncbi:FAD-dependent oxidoreductase [Bryobacter aggregatus]|uniref:FAD-dependent oxidoreductase n=1 Tax=Bryobacter aggregatus TaxID=360054 RepID=UPI0004E15B78|nr:FAD-dependent oxidoreductase [Bryobacter aggregatus]